MCRRIGVPPRNAAFTSGPGLRFISSSLFGYHIIIILLLEHMDLNMRDFCLDFYLMKMTSIGESIINK